MALSVRPAPRACAPTASCGELLSAAPRWRALHEAQAATTHEPAAAGELLARACLACPSLRAMGPSIPWPDVSDDVDSEGRATATHGTCTVSVYSVPYYAYFFWVLRIAEQILKKHILEKTRKTTEKMEKRIPGSIFSSHEETPSPGIRTRVPRKRHRKRTFLPGEIPRPFATQSLACARSASSPPIISTRILQI